MLDLKPKLSPEGGRYNRPPSLSFKASALMPGRYICKICGLPVPPEGMDDSGVCIVCADKVSMASNMVALVTGDKPLPATTGFNRILVELKKSTSPATVGIAEKVLELCGGHDGMAEVIWNDMKAVRGDNLPPELKSFHTTDHKVLQGYHRIIHDLLKNRDAMIEGSQDPLTDMNEEDLMTVVAEAARTRISVDSQFREDMAKLIYEMDPELIESLWLSKFGIPTLRDKPSVRVVEPVNA